MESVLDTVIEERSTILRDQQRSDGHWSFEVEADCTVSSEYILYSHFIGEVETAIERGIAQYLRDKQQKDGGWPLYYGGESNISATVKAYWALKLTGEDPDAFHMRRARELILSKGGAACSNVLTRYYLALFGQVPWRAVPTMLVECILLPRWFPFHLSKISYWSRTVLVPLLILSAFKARAKNPRGLDIRELFYHPPEKETSYHINPTGSRLGTLLLWLDVLIRHLEVFIPGFLRRQALRKAEKFIVDRLNGKNGLGAITPAMLGAAMALQVLGYTRKDAYMCLAMESAKKLLYYRTDGSIYCQPCYSPVWDTGIASHALLESGSGAQDSVIQKSITWLCQRQIHDFVGDWAERLKTIPRPGGWAFQYENPYYPDLDDTAVVGMLLHRSGDSRCQEPLSRAVEWVLGMQSQNGGWAAFDVDNMHSFLDHIPFADHGALRDPPTEDVTARCLSFLAQVGYTLEHPSVMSGVRYLLAQQQPDGSWFGRWGTNYIYGTWSVLSAFNVLGIDLKNASIRRAVDWLLKIQRTDGGWGEGCLTYWPERFNDVTQSISSQTAWALLGLMAAGEVHNSAVKRGISWLLNYHKEPVRWYEEYFTGVGFPRVYYLKYHGYALYFPLLSLARYRHLKTSNERLKWGF